MQSISRTMTTIYDTEQDFDTEAERIDHIETEEVMAYVPYSSKYRLEVINALVRLAKDLNDNPPAKPDSSPPDAS